MIWIGIVIGIFIGANIGFFIIALMIAAGRADELTGRMNENGN